MKASYILPLSAEVGVETATLAQVGGKGASLVRLIAAGLPVPEGFIVTTKAYRQFVEENALNERISAALAPVTEARRPSTLETASRLIGELFASSPILPAIAEAIVEAYGSFADTAPVAVRSSATAEDLPDVSFAGQQETYLNVTGVEAVLQAVKRCWASLWTARAIDYRMRHQVPQEAVDLAVVVQRLIPAEIAGIMFTANPVNNRHDEVVINAAWGLGEAIVSGTVSPDTIVAEKATGEVKHVEVADKTVMSVPTADGTAEEPVPERRRQARTLDDHQVQTLVRLGRQIEELYGAPQDIEWCWAAGTFAIVQARPITTLADAAPSDRVKVEVPPPTKWQVPNRRAKYMRNNIVELMPDPMAPLFGTLGRRVINREMYQLVTAFLGKPGVMPEQMIVPIEGYAYYNGDFNTKDIFYLLFNSIGIMKRMFTGAEKRWLDGHDRYTTVVASQSAEPWRSESTPMILDRVTEVLGAAIAYYGALVSGLIPAAWISEGLFTFVYERLIRRREDPRAAVYLLGFDSQPILSEKSLYDLADWSQERPELAAYLLSTQTDQVATQNQAPAGIPEADWEAWRARFEAHLDAYGAMIYDLDFTKPTAVGDPTPVLETLKLYLRGEGRDPYARQQAASEQREAAIARIVDRLKGPRLKWFKTSLARAQKYAPQREDGLAVLGLGYPLIRKMLLEIGMRLVKGGIIDEADDVFWLEEAEIAEADTALNQGKEPRSCVDTVAYRKALWQARRQMVPPMALPMPPKFLSSLFPALGGAEAEDEAAERSRTIKGTACSPGTVTATARVLHGPEDFDTMEAGEVLVAGITTPAWTPLFAMAAGVVTDIGGPLSHGSIVAREYAIPAVLGTGNATRRIKSGDRVRVDGARGTVEILEKA